MSPTIVKGPLQMIVSSFFFGLMAFYAKLASVTVSGQEVVFFRFLLGVIAALIMAALGRVDLRAQRKDLLIARGIFGGTAILLYFAAIAGGSVINSTVLNNSYPIYIVPLAALFLKEKITWPVCLSLLAAWFGVGLLVHPDFTRIFWPDLLALASGIVSACAIVVVRQLRKSGEPAWTVFFYLSIFGLIASLVCSLPVWVWPDANAWIYLSLTAVTGLFAQVMMTSAYKYINASAGSILSMTTMVFGSIFGLIGLGETMTFGEAAGALLIALGGGMVAWLNSRENWEKFTAAGSAADRRMD